MSDVCDHIGDRLCCIPGAFVPEMELWAPNFDVVFVFFGSSQLLLGSWEEGSARKVLWQAGQGLWRRRMPLGSTADSCNCGEAIPAILERRSLLGMGEFLLFRVTGVSNRGLSSSDCLSFSLLNWQSVRATHIVVWGS